jgi:hypothetical protein
VPPRTGAPFVEVAVGPAFSLATGCCVEVVRADGARMSVRTEAIGDLAALTSAFLSSGL